MKKKIIIIASITLFLAIAVSVGFIIYGMTSFSTDDVTLEILAPREFKSGDKVDYKLVYKNSSRQTLEEAKINFQFPENSKIIKKAGITETEKGKIKIDIGEISRGEEGSVEVSARIFGPTEELKEADASLIYSPAELSAIFQAETSFTASISSVPLSLNFDFQENVISGQKTEIVLNYTSTSNALFEDMGIKVEYPGGFTQTLAEPSPLQNKNIWNIGDIRPNSEDKIIIEGVLEGDPGDLKFFSADVGPLDKDSESLAVYTSKTDSVEISTSAFALTQTVNRQSSYIADVGENLNFTINYKNNTSEVLRSVIVEADLKGVAFDFGSIEVHNGSFDGVTNKITWNAGTDSQLEFVAPGAEGSISFSADILDRLPIEDFSDKNFIISSNARIGTEFVPEKLKGTNLTVENKMEVKVNSRALLSAKGYYYDATISNSGPIPPKVGQTTTYNLVWQIINVNNDIENVEVTANLPPHVKWLDVYNPSTENVSYDESTGKLTWKIDKVFAGTGILRPVKDLAFQVSITPSLPDVGKNIKLISNPQLRAKDSFTKEVVSDEAKKIDTALPDDPAMTSEKGKVIE